MKQTELDSFEDALRYFYWLSFIGVACVVCIFTLKFASDRGVSGNPSDWGVFGDYVGGTLGSFFGLLAFFGVLLTVSLQRKQLHQMQEQSHIDELQRYLAGCADRVDRLLHTELNFLKPDLAKAFSSIGASLSPLVLLAGVAKSHGDDDSRSQAIIDIFKETGELNFPVLEAEFADFARCMKIYVERGGNDDIVGLYRSRYGQIVSWLHIVRPAAEPNIFAMFSSTGVSRDGDNRSDKSA